MTDDLDFYELLGVDRDASKEDIRTAFRGQVRQYHPDLNDDPRAAAQFTALKKAYDTLADEKEREAYDRMGHSEYVTKRISGLPSPDQWQIPDREGREESTVDTRTGRATTATGASTSSGSSTATGTGPSGTTSTSRTESERSGGAAAGSSTGRSTASTNGSKSGSRGTANAWTTPDAGTTSGRSSGGSKTGAAGRGTARSPSDAAASASTAGGTTTGTRSAGGTSATSGSAETGSGPAGRGGAGRVGGSIRRWFHEANLGWPLILLADAMYFAGMAAYLADNGDGVGRLVDAVAAAGPSPGAVQGVLTAPTRYGIETLPAFLRTEIARTDPTGAPLVLAGMAFLPSVYLFIIHETRRIRTPWQPSYLYVVGAVAPIVGLVVTLLAQPAGLFVETVCYVVLPVATMVGLPFSAFVRPWMMRRFRRVWWRITG